MSQGFATMRRGNLISIVLIGGMGACAVPATAETIMTVTEMRYDASLRLQCKAVRMNPAQWSLPADACTPSSPGPDGSDRITRYEYDAAGQLLKEVRALGTPLQQDYVTYTYTPNGKQASVTDANGNKAALEYDGHDRQVRWRFPSKTTVGQVSSDDYEEYGYDANGNRTSLRRRDGRTLSFTYDALNRVTAKVVPDGPAPIQVGAVAPAAATRDVYYGYDLRGLQTHARFDSHSGEGVTSVYDGFGRLTSSTTTMGGTSRTLGYQYDLAGNRTQLVYPDSTPANPVVLNELYDGLNRSVASNINGSIGVSETVYNAQGERYYLKQGDGSVKYAVYDGIGRLAGTSQQPVASEVGFTFVHNPASQIVTLTRNNDTYAWTGAVNADRAYVTNGLNQYTAAGSAAFQYDANGNLLTSGTAEYAYDAENRLIGTSAQVSLTYDPLGRLFQTAQGNGGVTRFLYDGDALVAEYDGNGTMLRRYVHGTGVDDPLLMLDGSSLATSAQQYLRSDHQGAILSLANRDGTVTAINSYDEYGIPAATNVGRFQYTGQAWIPELGMYHYKARIYSPTLGRFLQTDPIGYDDQVNLYAYVGNDPVNLNDPSGNCAGPLAAPCVVAGGAIIVRGAQCAANAGCREAVKIGVRWAIREVVKQLTTTPVVSPMNSPDSDGPTISENRGNRGGQGQGERGETRNPDRAGKHTTPDLKNPGQTIVNRPGAKPYSRPAREGEQGYKDRSAPPVPTIPRGKRKNDE